MIPKKQPKISDAEVNRFANWADSESTLDMAKDLKKRGLEGADQLIDDTSKVNVKDASSIKNSQSDWKMAAIQHMLANAKRLNIRKPEEFDANLSALTSTLAPQYKDALRNPSFSVTHPNFLPVVKSILKDQYAKEDKNKNQIAINSAKSVEEFLKK